MVPGVAVETVPGIMALQDLAARSGTVLAHGTETLALMPLTAGVDAYRRAVADHDTVVAYKGGRVLPQVLAVLDEAGRLDGSCGAAVYGAAVGLPGSDIRPAGELPAAEPGPYLSTIIATRRPLWPTDSSDAEDGVGEDGGAGRGRRRGREQGRGRVTFVGAGPGAADLLTLRGVRVVAEADLVVWASSLVHPDVVAHARPGAQVVDSAGIPLESVASLYRRAADEGLHIARVHSGDPTLWGAVQEQLEICAELGLATEIVPGVSSVTAAAAAVQRELTVPEVAQTVILTRLGGGKTPMPPREQVRELARHGTTMALFLSTARSAQLQRELLDGGYPADTPCVVAYRVSWPEELVLHCTLGDLAGTVKAHRLWKHTLVLVGPGLAAGGTRSHLYHPGHFHGFRRAESQARAALRAHDTALARSGRPGYLAHHPGHPGPTNPA
jgi:precorrin-4 C11-methyltransferase